MNPLTNVKNLQKLNERELELGIIGKKSWHDEYKDSAWLFIGGLPYDLSEGDVLCVFSQYGEIVNLNLVRDNKTGKSKGFAFLCYEDQRSTVLAVDNLNGIKILGRVIRVDHVKDYKIPKEYGNEDELTMKIRQEGCQPKLESSSEEEEDETEADKKPKKDKKKKKEKKKKKKREKSSSNENSDSETDDRKPNIAVKVEVKQEKSDPGYDKALANSSLSRSMLRKEIKKEPEEKEGRNSNFRSRDDSRNQRNERGRELYSSYDREKKRSDRFETESSAANGFHGRGNFNDSFDRHRDRSRDRNREKERNNRYEDRERESVRHREKEDRSRDRHGESDRRDRERRSERDYDRGEDKYRQRDRHR